MMASSSAMMIQPRCTLHRTTSPGPKLCRAGSFAAAAATANEAAAAASMAISASASASAAPVASVARTASTPRTTTASWSVANMWWQVHGSHDWDGLLQPLHPVVRDEVARYGELVGACYKALDVDPPSPRRMCCKHPKERVLEEAGVGVGVAAGAPGYEVTRYIYATPGVAAGPSTSWVGYVAVSTDEMTRRLGRRDVLVSLRGTVTHAEWAANLMSALEPAACLDARPGAAGVKVEAGFLNLYTSSAGAGAGGMGSCRDQLLREVSRVIKSFPHEDLSVTLAGHSMGSALAMLLGYDLAQLGLNRDAASGRRVPVAVFSFGGPRVGNAAFKDRCDELGVKVLRVANVRDPVTMLPGALFNEGTSGLLASLAGDGDRYTHVGVELALDFLSLRDLGSVHDLGAYVSSIRAQACGKASKSNDNAVVADSRGSAFLAKAMEFVGSRRAAAFAWPEAALGIGGVVQGSRLDLTARTELLVLLATSSSY